MSQTNAESTTISLEELATKYLNVLQKSFDMLNYSLASSRKVNESDYDEFSNQLQVMPRQRSRLQFEDAKRATQQWVVRNTLADSLALVLPLLEDARTICALCDFKTSGETDQSKLQEIANEERVTFVSKPLPEKFAYIKEKFGIESEVQEHILSLMEFTKALMTKNGVLTEEEAVNGVQTLKIRSVQIVQNTNEESGSDNLSLSRKMGDFEREFKVGEDIHFNKAEQIGSLVTIGIFITNILKGIQTYAQDSGAANS